MIKKQTRKGMVSVAKALIVVMSLACVMSFVGCKKEEAKTETKQETETTTEETNTETPVESVSESTYVENATYSLPEIEGKSYKLMGEDSKEYSIKDIVLPNIKLDSEDAKKANDEIKGIFDGVAQEINTELKETEHMFYCTANYKAYENNGILSVVITMETGGSDVPQHTYYTYNFDLDTKAAVDYNTILTKAGYTADTVDAKIREAIKTTSSLKDITAEDCEEGKTVDSYIDESLANFKETIKEGKGKYLLGENGKLTVDVLVSIPAGGGLYNELLVIG